MASRSLPDETLSITRREWDELQDVLMALETVILLDLDPEPSASLAKSVESRFRRLVHRMRPRFDPEAADAFE